jgi:hypothetical protein
MGFRDKGLRHSSRLLLLLSVTALSACTTRAMNPPVVVKEVETFTNSFLAMPFMLLPAGEEVQLLINNQDASFRFAGGDSYYEALTLPDLARPYVIKVRSDLVTTKSDLHGEIFYPVLTFLDTQKQVLMTLDNLPYVLKEPATAKNYMQASVQISDQLANARYMVVHTQDDKLNQAIAKGDGQSILRTGGYQTMLFAPQTKPRYRVNFSATGQVKITASQPGAETKSTPPAANY